MSDSDPAFGIPRLVFIHGRERAREMVEPKMRPLVDIAAEVLTDETQRIGISYTGFCLTALPHKRLPDDAPWEKKGHMVTLLVEPGRLRTGGRTKLHGVPYGARARMILLYLQTQAIRSGSREVALGRSMREWMERMGLAVGGETAKALREQAARISACSLKFFWEDGASDGFSRSAIVRSGLRFHAEDSAQGTLWEDRVVLDEAFYAALRDHPVPLLETAIRQLRDRSMSLDLYVWLAWRLHQLGKPTQISWPAVYGQFGTGFKAIRQFKPRFIEALAAALAAYPEARVEVGGSRNHHPSGKAPCYTDRVRGCHLTPHPDTTDAIGPREGASRVGWKTSARDEPNRPSSARIVGEKPPIQSRGSGRHHRFGDDQHANKKAARLEFWPPGSASRDRGAPARGRAGRARRLRAVRSGTASLLRPGKG